MVEGRRIFVTVEQHTLGSVKAGLSALQLQMTESCRVGVAPGDRVTASYGHGGSRSVTSRWAY